MRPDPFFARGLNRRAMLLGLAVLPIRASAHIGASADGPAPVVERRRDEERN